MKTSNRRFWAILALFAVMIVACGGDGATTTAGATETTAATTTAAAETTAATETTATAEEGFLSESPGTTTTRRDGPNGMNPR